MSDPAAGLTLGFLTVLHDAAGSTGGYLVTNAWGRPLEFRLTTPVQPNRVQRILYGPTLDDYIHADLIGKTLFDRTSVTPAIIVAEHPSLVALRSRIDVPVVVLNGDGSFTHTRSATPLQLASEADRDVVIALLDRVDAAVDLAEPFARIKDAVTEARKPGVLTRAAA